MRKLLIAAGLIAALAFWWLLVDNRADDVPAAPLDIALLRREAARLPGPLPERAGIETVAIRHLPGAALAAGTGLKRRPVSVQAIQLSGPGGDVIIDSGFSADDAKAMGFDHYYPGAQARVDAALRTARTIVFTHEHPDHMNGFLRLPQFAAAARHALVPPAQRPSSRAAADLPWPADAGEVLPRFDYRGVAAVAPGVVLIAAPSHTPGSQMVFVRLANGRELLFTGDIASMERNWRETRARSRLVSDWIAPEDRAAVFAWLKAVRALKRENPAMAVIPSHDYARLHSKRHPLPLASGFLATDRDAQARAR